MKPWRLRPRTGLAVLALAALIALVVSHDLDSRRQAEFARLDAIAELKAQQIADWLAERQRDADFIQEGGMFADQFRPWRRQGDLVAAERLQSRLEQLRQTQGVAAITLFDDHARILWAGSQAPGQPAPVLRAAVREAAVDGRVRWLGPYTGLAGRSHLDLLVPLPEADAPPWLLVLHLDPRAWLGPTLRSWPGATAGNEVLLLRRQGNQYLILAASADADDALPDQYLPLGADSLGRRLLEGSAGSIGFITGLDQRQTAVIGALRVVPGTDWLLLAKTERRNLYRYTLRPGLGVATAGLLLLFIAGAAIERSARRRQPATGEDPSGEQRAPSLAPLQTMAENPEAIVFAKDQRGRYILCSPAACRLLGKPAEAVLGRDDLTLFPQPQADLLMQEDRQIVADNRGTTTEETLDFADGERTLLTTKGPLRDGSGRAVGVFGIVRDITQERRAEAALRQEWVLRQRYLDTVQAIVLALDLEGRITMINSAGCRLLGWSEAQLLGKEWFATCLPQNEVRAEVFDVFCQLLAGQKQSELHQNQVLCRDGSERWIAWHSNPLTDDAGRVVGMLSAGEDVTERRQVEASLDQSEGRFRALVEQSLAGIYIIQDGGFRYVNPGFAAIFGYASAEDLIDRLPAADLVAPADRARVAENVRQRIEGETADLHYTFRGLRQDGSEIDVEVHGRRFQYQGRPAVIGLVLDITARKAAEDSLRASELRFHDIISASADWVWELDANGRYTYASDSVQALLGYTPEEIRGHTPFDLMSPEEAARVEKLFADIAARRASFHDLDNVCLHKDGSERRFQTNGIPVIDEAGQLRGYRGLDRDVTEKRRAELVLRETSDRLRALISTIPDLVWLKDPAGRYLDCNPRFSELIGLPEAEILGRTDYDFFAKELADFFREKDLAAVAAGAPTVNEEELSFASDGHKEVVQTIKTPIHGKQGLIGVLGIARDITAIRRAEAALKRQTDELQARYREMERFNRAMVGREVDMIELKRTVNELSRELGRTPPFDLSFIARADDAGREEGT